MVIVDLKTTELPLGSRERDQAWKYEKELKAKGHIRQHTRVDGFILGSIIEQGEDDSISHSDEVKIIPILYEAILTRAEKRLESLRQGARCPPSCSNSRSSSPVFSIPCQCAREASLGRPTPPNVAAEFSIYQC